MQLNECVELGVVLSMAYPDAFQSAKGAIAALKEVERGGNFSFIETVPIPVEWEKEWSLALADSPLLPLAMAGSAVIYEQRVDPDSPVETERQRAVETLKPVVDQAQRLGYSVVALATGPYVADWQLQSARTQALTCSLMDLCAYAQDAGITILVETFDSVIDKRRSLGCSYKAAHITAEVAAIYANIGLLPDLSHIPLIGEGIEESLVAMGSHVKHVHVGNCVLTPGHPFYGDSHPEIGVSGGAVGTNELAVFLRTLVDTGYLRPNKKGRVAVEVKSQPGQDPRAVLNRTETVLHQAWELVGC